MNNHIRGITAVIVLYSLLMGTAAAAVRLPAIFGDHMVLQQKSKVTIWGWADPGEKVTVKGSWQWLAAHDRADDEGRWSVTVRTPRAGKPVSLSVKGSNEIKLNDILLGEVWICSGQSNMEWTMAALKSDTARQDIQQAALPQVRLFTVNRTIATTPQADCQGQWQVCSPETAAAFSATGFYFGRSLHEHLDVPIGLISTNWGGTKAEAWTSRETLAGFEPFSDQLALVAAAARDGRDAADRAREQLLAWEEQIAALDPGTREQWFADDVDDADWQTVNLPAVWSATELAEVDGIVWYRRHTNLPPSWAKSNLQLHLGTIDDIDTVWVNGVRIGTTAGWDRPRVYDIPAAVLRTGRNTIAVRVIDQQGEGGFSGDPEDLRIGPAGADVKTCATVAGTWRCKLSHTGAVPANPAEDAAINQNTATVLYNGMIAPLVPFRIAGAIWYQGESNCYDPILYRSLFPAMITDWRRQWDQGDFPFYYVQIAPFRYNGNTRSQAIREAQFMTLAAVDNVGMAVTLDIGEENDIHPKNKHDVGDRLARWALANTYGQTDVVYSGPLYRTMTVDHGAVRIGFDAVDGGLVAAEGGLRDFMIAGADRQFVPAQAVLDGDTVVVSSPSVTEPVAVRYGWSNWVTGSLFNAAGLPTSSFRTDDWPDY